MKLRITRLGTGECHIEKSTDNGQTWGHVSAHTNEAQAVEAFERMQVNLAALRQRAVLREIELPD
jgi:hypothetical protein